MTSLPQLRQIAGFTCLVNAPAAPVARLLLAHGAGAAMDTPFMSNIAERLAERGVTVIRFEFPYMSKRRVTGKKSPPDRQPVLLDTWRILVAALAAEPGPPLLIGGKSMGGRMATLLAAEQAKPLEKFTIAGIICLGYPFHPPGKPDRLRVEHLHALKVPVLIVQGTRDAMGNSTEVPTYHLPAGVEVAWLDTANHDLKPLVRSGYTHDQYLSFAADRVVHFIKA